MPAITFIEQTPIFSPLPVGQEIIFVVSNNQLVSQKTKLKFVVKVFISSTTPPDVSVNDDLIGVFKTTPNNAGVGMFNVRNVVENYVNADNMAAEGSAYKGLPTGDIYRNPIHLIDKFSLSQNSIRYMKLQFYVEYLNSTTNVIEAGSGTEIESIDYLIFNGYLKYTDDLVQVNVAHSSFGFNITQFFLNAALGRFLTNAPSTQYANLEDYGTVGMLMNTSNPQEADKIVLTYYDNSDSQIGTEDVEKTEANGAYGVTAGLGWTSAATKQLLFLGCFPGNLQNWSTTFQALVTAGTIQDGYYTIEMQNDADTPMSELYTISLNCPNARGYESIRLAWLNQWGAWDYYTFTKKSVKTLSTKGTTYTQLGGTWNEAMYRSDSYKGGKKSFRVNTTEKIKMNTGFVREDDAVMFEELINCPEVYLLKGYGDSGAAPYVSTLNQWVTPVRVTSKSLERKTIANDRLMQYTFEVEKTKTFRTQAV